MKVLSQHIEYLLTRHDCVILPGFGAFIAENRAAELDVVKDLYLPPVRTVSFNTAVISDDGLVAHSISRKSRTSFEEARKILDHKIETLRTSLNNNGEISLGKIGTLHQEDDHRICFIPATKALAKASRIGATPFKLPSSLDQHAMSVADNPIDSSHNLNPITTDDKYYTLRIPKVLVRVAASIVILCCAMLSLIVPASNTQRNSYKASVVEVESLIRTIDKHNTTVKTKSATHHKVHKTTAPLKTVSEDTNNLYLIVGTFKTEKQARSFISSFPDDRLTIASEGKIWRVAAKSSSSRSELQKIINTPEFRNRFPGAWIWEAI